MVLFVDNVFAGISVFVSIIVLGGRKPPVEMEMEVEMPKKGFNQAAKWKDSATTLPAQQGPQVAVSGLN